MIFPSPRSTIARPSSRASTNWRRKVHFEHTIPEVVGMLSCRPALDRPGVEDEDVDRRGSRSTFSVSLRTASRSPRSQRWALNRRPLAVISAPTSSLGVQESCSRRSHPPLRRRARAPPPCRSTTAPGDEGRLPVERATHDVQSTSVLIPLAPAAISARTTGSRSRGSTALIKRSRGSTSAASSSIARSKSSGSYTRAPRS